jgi:basic membrane protein A
VRVARILALALILALIATSASGCALFGAKKKPKVGIVFDVGGRGDKSFNDSAYAGLEKIIKEYGDKIETKYLEPKGSGEAREQYLRQLAELKYDAIVGVGFAFTDSLNKVAKDFPKVKFALIDGFIDKLDAKSNIICMGFNEHEGSFLVGVAAALATKTKKVGFVGGMKIGLIEKFEYGFKAGVAAVDPKIEVFSDYVGTTVDAFKNPTVGKELSKKQIRNKADVVYHASGQSGVGVIEACAEAKVLVIGVDSDQYLTAKDAEKPYVLTSMLKRVDVAVYDFLKSVVDDVLTPQKDNPRFKGGYRSFGMKDNGVGYAESNAAAIKDYKAKVEEFKAKVIKGEIVVPFDKAGFDAYLAKLPKPTK